MPVASSAKPSSFPQIGSGRTWGDLADELADYTGGKARPDIAAKAERSLRRAIRRLNQVPWIFNRKTDTFDLEGASSGTAEFDLESDFRSPRSGLLRDSAGKTKDTIQWIRWAGWEQMVTDTMVGR